MVPINLSRLVLDQNGAPIGPFWLSGRCWLRYIWGFDTWGIVDVAINLDNGHLTTSEFCYMRGHWGMEV